MRVICPKCQERFSAKSNARRIKCPACGFREEAPEGGFAAAFSAKKRPDGFVPSEPRPSPTATRPVWIMVGVVALVAVAAAGAWYLMGGSGGSSAQAVCADFPNGPPVGQPGPVQLDLITPGVWNVCSDKDTMFVWVHNNGSAPMPYEWKVTGLGGQPLPPGWDVSFEQPSGTLDRSSNNTDATGNADWAGTLATLTIPADHPAADVPAELHAAGAFRPIMIHVQAPRGEVSQVGQTVQTCYDLRGEAGNPIQQGPYELEVGATGPGHVVDGYAYGVAGVAPGETVALVVPPPFAYGYSGGDLAGQTLQWSTRVGGDMSNCQRVG